MYLYILTLHAAALLNLLINSKSLSINSTQSCYLLTRSFIFYFPIHMSSISFSGLPAMTRTSDIMLKQKRLQQTSQEMAFNISPFSIFAISYL